MKRYFSFLIVSGILVLFPYFQAASEDNVQVTADYKVTGEKLNTGEKIYNQSCKACHGTGVAGAPKIGDSSAWQERIPKGMTTLIENSVQGFKGDQGYMPPKGGNSKLTEEEVAAAAAYMVFHSK